ncbi:P-loop NTPase fold protein [Psychrobacter piscatorii]|uniref:P-loop NTPase fold protein n=1 Tax=Psychrobacter piscatorii TaxID=554343 RepID=UPI003735B09B
MANVANLEKRLVDLIREESSFAIALTGEWGVGKTYFWKYFKQRNLNQFRLQKYAYVSLFGIDSLDSLKYEIAVKTHAINQLEDRMQGAKSLFNKALDTIDLSSIQGKGLSLNIGKSLITSALSSLVSSTVICIDDIERISDSLSLKDVMGVINDLKLEKKCQVVVILHDAKANDQFQEYKEKVFDELLVLDDSLSIINDIVDSKLFTVYKQFYEIIGIKNLRFYQRVDKSFKLFDKAYPSLSHLSKEQILRFILIIRMIYEIPSRLGNDIDFKFFVDSFNSKNIKNFRGYKKQNAYKEQNEISDDIVKFNKINDYIHPFYNYFEISDWGEVIVSWITELDFDKEVTKDLIAKDKITEEVLLIDRLASEVLNEFHNIDLKPNFAERLYYVACAKIGRAQLTNLSFYCDILDTCNRKNLAIQLEIHIKRHIENSIKYHQIRISIDDFYSFGRKENDRFYNFTVDKIANYKYKNISSNTISSIFLDFHEHSRRAYNSNDKEILELIDKDILREIIWINTDKFLGNRKLFIHSILLHPCLGEINGKREEIRLWILELLQENIVDNPNNEPSIKMWLDNTNDLTENLT